MTDRPGQAGPPDSGLFGPGSVTWRILSEPVMWIAGLRAMYLQALHPRVMLGTWQNTAFAKPDEAWGRFTRTVEFVRVRTYGTTAEVERLGARLRKVHAALPGVDGDGQRFRLDEPELLLWVHCGEVGSYAEIARRSGVHVTPAELDAFIDEQRRSAAVVGLDPAAVPASMAELAEYYEQMRPRLRACPEARHALRLSFTPKLPPALLPLRLARAAAERAGLRQHAALGAPDVRHAGHRPDRRGGHPGAAGRLRVQHPDPAAGLPAGRSRQSRTSRPAA